MSLKSRMTLGRARELAKTITTARAKWGAQVSVPISVHELLEIVDVLETEGNWDAPSREDLTKANRQNAALNARLAKCLKKNGDEATDEDEAE